MTTRGDKNYKVGLILFLIGEGLAILEAIGLLIYDIILNFNDKLYGYGNWQTMVYIAASVFLTAGVATFGILAKRSEKKKAKIFLKFLIGFSAAAFTYGIYGVLNNIMTDMNYYYFTEISEIISYAARQLLLLIVSGNGFIIIGSFALFLYSLKKSKVN